MGILSLSSDQSNIANFLQTQKLLQGNKIILFIHLHLNLTNEIATP